MQKKELINDKTKNAANGMLSGILTSIFYDIISDAYYIQKNENGIIQYVQIDKVSKAEQLLIVAGFFILLWTLFSVILPNIAWILYNVSNRRRKRRSVAEIVDFYFNIKKETLSLCERIYSNRNLDICSAVIFAEDLFFAISQLQEVFCPKSGIQQIVVETSFRKYTWIGKRREGIISDAKVYISPYCFKSLVTMLRSTVLFIYENNKGVIWDQDKDAAILKLAELENVVNHINTKYH